MFQEFEATATVGEGGRVEILIPHAAPGAQVRIAVRELVDSEWFSLLGNGTLHGPSLSDESLRRESIYSEETN